MSVAGADQLTGEGNEICQVKDSMDVVRRNQILKNIVVLWAVRIVDIALSSSVVALLGTWFDSRSSHIYTVSPLYLYVHSSFSWPFLFRQYKYNKS